MLGRDLFSVGATPDAIPESQTLQPRATTISYDVHLFFFSLKSVVPEILRVLFWDRNYLIFWVSNATKQGKERMGKRCSLPPCTKMCSVRGLLILRVRTLYWSTATDSPNTLIIQTRICSPFMFVLMRFYSICRACQEKPAIPRGLILT